MSSPWFQDSARAGIALGVAVLVALLGSRRPRRSGSRSGRSRSSARTRSTPVGRRSQAAAGTAVGFAVAAAVLAVLGVDRVGLWIVMIVAYFCAAYFPQVLGFVAGQAAFTVLVVALFNLIVPEGWRTGLVRIEDIAIGATVSVVVALVFWPRRAEVTLRKIAATLYRALAACRGRARSRAPSGGAGPHASGRGGVHAVPGGDGGRPRDVDARGVCVLAADTARNGLRIFEFDRRQMGDGLCPETRHGARRSGRGARPRLGRHRVGDRATPPVHPPSPGDWITDCRQHPGPGRLVPRGPRRRRRRAAAVRAAFAREWLIALTQLTAPVAASVGRPPLNARHAAVR